MQDKIADNSTLEFLKHSTQKKWDSTPLKFGVLALLIVFGSLGYLFLVRPNPYWCQLQPTAKAIYDGRPSTARFYSKANGQFLLAVPEDGVTYRIVPDKQEIWWSARRLEEIPSRGAWDEDTYRSPYGVHLGYVGGKKVASIREDTDSVLLISSKRIEFNGLEGKHIIVTW